MDLDRPAALRRECADVALFCRDLTDQEWSRPSAAPGWRVQDVMAHISGSCRAIFTSSLALMTTKDIERTNDVYVDRRRDWTPQQVCAEFERWSPRLTTLTRLLSRTPVAKVGMPLGELGTFPAGVLLNSALVFDWHTHLRYDVAPVLGRAAPPVDEERMAVVLEWMLAVLGNQLRAAHPSWLDRPVSLTLTGPGGGSWLVGSDLRITSGDPADGAARIAGQAEDFPGWGTTRTPWRDADVKIDGDTHYGARFLDALNVV
jgi:uncharacterized protein (TIGR03083 family)